MVRSRGYLGQASRQVLHGHLHDTDRITLKISHLNRWQYENRVSGNMCIGNAVFHYMRSLQALAAKAGVGLNEDRRIIAGDDGE